MARPATRSGTSSHSRPKGQGKHKHGGSFRWKSWLTHQDDDDSWYQPETENYPDEELEVWIEQELPPADMEYEYEEEDREGGQQDYDNQADEQAEWADPTNEEAQALTATSKPRGYYRTDKGKGKSYKGGQRCRQAQGQVRQGQRPWCSPVVSCCCLSAWLMQMPPHCYLGQPSPPWTQPLT